MVPRVATCEDRWSLGNQGLNSAKTS